MEFEVQLGESELKRMPLPIGIINVESQHLGKRFDFNITTVTAVNGTNLSRRRQWTQSIPQSQGSLSNNVKRGGLLMT